jgi:integrase
MLVCPECGNKKTWKDGLRYVQDTPIQRFLCRSCGYRFSQTTLNRYKDPEGVQNVHRMPLNMPSSLLSNRQICVTKTSGAKNLVKVETRTETALRESTQDTKGQIVSFAWHLKKLGRSNATIKTYTKNVQNISKYGNINDPESIKLAIATHFKDRNTKRLACYAYDAFLKFLGIQWEKPDYRQEHKRVFIPTEQELQTVINTGRKRSIVFSLFLYETGARVNEAERLEWTDLDRERNKVTVKASKNGNARIVTVSKHLMDLLFSLPKTEKTVFPKRSPSARQTGFYSRMKNLARVHQNPRFLKIHRHTFRHCKALREYDKTKNILHVKKVLGHKSIMTTQRYVELYEEIYGDMKPENYICETASNVKEAKKLVESGFEYVCEIEGEQLFRKCK